MIFLSLELVTNVQFANDEGDPGMGLELGIDLLVYGGNCLNSTARHLLTVGYTLLDREAFAKIVNAHLNRRRETQACFKAEWYIISFQIIIFKIINDCTYNKTTF